MQEETFISVFWQLFVPCLLALAGQVCMNACVIISRVRRPAASRRAFHVLDGAVRKHRFLPHLSGSRGMSSVIADEKQKTWEVFSSGTADRSAETKVLLNIHSLTLGACHWDAGRRHWEPAGVSHVKPPQERPSV